MNKKFKDSKVTQLFMTLVWEKLKRSIINDAWKISDNNLLRCSSNYYYAGDYCWVILGLPFMNRVCHRIYIEIIELLTQIFFFC